MPRSSGPVLKVCKFNTENNNTLVKTIIFPVQLSNNRHYATFEAWKTDKPGALIRVQYCTVIIKGKKRKKIQTEMTESLKIWMCRILV